MAFLDSARLRILVPSNKGLYSSGVSPTRADIIPQGFRLVLGSMTKSTRYQTLTTFSQPARRSASEVRNRVHVVDQPCIFRCGDYLETRDQFQRLAGTCCQHATVSTSPEASTCGVSLVGTLIRVTSLGQPHLLQFMQHHQMINVATSTPIFLPFSSFTIELMPGLAG